MPLFILAETSAGYGLFKAKDKKLLERDDVELRLSTAEKINQELKLKEFVKWESASAAVAEIGALIEGKVPPMLAGLMESIKDEKKVSLAVADKSIGIALQKLPGFNITALASGSSTTDLYRGIRSHISGLIPGILPENFKTMSLGLSHSLSRHKLRFSADKVDVMIIQAINLLDDLDKELNTYAMRVKEWYGWHFPELGKILNDNLAYARVILSLGMRSNASKVDLSEILPEEIETAVKAAADLSMGTEISDEDLENIRLLAEQVVAYSEYRAQLSSYLDARMRAIAPNLTELVGYLVGARLIAHAGSLMNLAKNPGSTIQILGAEKALFRALKTKHATPKYGLIYHASLVGQATGKNKGKIARQLASKAALGVRTDALTEHSEGKEVDEDERGVFGAAQRAKIEANLRRLEGKPILAKGITVGPNGKAAPTPSKWDIKEARKYNVDADGLAGDEPASQDQPTKESKKKEKKKNKKQIEEANGRDASDNEMEDAPTANGAADGNFPSSPTLANMSDDPEEEPETLRDQWRSPTVGASRSGDKSHEKERRQCDLKLARQRAAKREILNTQGERRTDDLQWPTTNQVQTQRHANHNLVLTATLKASSKPPRKLSEADYERLAASAGISVSKFKRKYERGDVEVDEDGNPVVHSKKEMKKLRKALDAASSKGTPSGEKRKREEDGEAPKKKKKHSSS